MGWRVGYRGAHTEGRGQLCGTSFLPLLYVSRPGWLKLQAILLSQPPEMDLQVCAPACLS